MTTEEIREEIRLLGARQIIGGGEGGLGHAMRVIFNGLVARDSRNVAFEPER